MPRLVIAAEGDAERDLCIAAPPAAWLDASADSYAARQGLADTFLELREPVCRYLLALGLPGAEAEEVVQETFLRLCQHLASGGSSENLRGWVFRVAHNLAQDQHRRRRRRPSQPLEDASANGRAYTDPVATPEQQAIDQQRSARLQSAIGRLPVHQRECLHLRAEGLRYREIAEVLGAGVSTVADWIQQALKTLAKECHEHD